jgi:excisionase family DNA binding protein
MAGEDESRPDDLMTTGEAARLLDLSPDGVRWIEREGRLPAQRTTNGQRLFRRGDVEALAAERARRAVTPSKRGARAGRGT